MKDSETRDRLDDVIAKLEAASEGSRELDEAIGEALLNGRERNPKPYGAWAELVSEYTTSLDAALTLVPEGWKTYAVDGPAIDHDGLWTWMLVAGERGTHGTSHCPTLALCIAALKARREGDNR